MFTIEFILNVIIKKRNKPLNKSKESHDVIYSNEINFSKTNTNNKYFIRNKFKRIKRKTSKLSK